MRYMMAQLDSAGSRPRRRLVASGALVAGGALVGVTSATRYTDHWFDPVFLGAVTGWGLLAWGTYEQFLRRAPDRHDDDG